MVENNHVPIIRQRKRTASPSPNRLVFVKVEQGVFDVLSAYSAIYDIPKSDILNKLLQEWAHRIELEGLYIHYRNLVARVQADWYQYKTMELINQRPEEVAQAFNKYIKTIQTRLRRNGVKEEYVKTLPNRVRQ